MVEQDDVVVELDTRKLDAFLKAVSDENVFARVGILGKNGRTGGGKTNAEIGMDHEFGRRGLPIRSFLRMPIAEKMQAALDAEDGAFSEEALQQVVATKSTVPWMTSVAITALGIVLEAFDTGGFGKWKPSNMKYKTNKQTLIETTQLRNSVTYDVKGGE